MKIEELQNKKILILGYGKEGQASQAFLKAQFPGIDVEHADKNTDPNYLDRQKKYDLVIKTPGLPKELVTVPYTTATNIFFANCQNKIIGITGTKGKSTTSSLIYHLLKTAGIQAHLVGNIGVPALSLLSQPLGKDDVIVMELSSYQLDDIKYSPHISVVLNLFPEHMNYHGNSGGYYEAKKNIIAHVQKEDYFFYNPQYEMLVSWAANTICISKPFLPHNIPIDDSKLPLKGKHNKQNIQAALCVADIFNISEVDVAGAIQSFQPLPHRLQNIGTYKGIMFYDDAISTTPQSTLAALDAIQEVDTILLGGQDRGYDFSTLVDDIKKRNIKNIVLFPDSSAAIKKALQDQGVTISHLLETKDMEEAVKFAYIYTKKGGICLLSTASPSYSIWKNFEEKGDLFRLYVQTYGKK